MEGGGVVRVVVHDDHHNHNKHPGMEADTSEAAVTTTTESESYVDISDGIIISKENPMTNDVILKALFEKMSQQGELNRVRLVCKQWYKLVIPVWLKNGSTIVIKSDEEDDAFLKFLEQAHLAPPTAHEGIVGIKQYPKLHLEHSEQIYSRMHFEVFWNEYGNYLTHLTLGNFKIPDPVAFKDILFCRFTPNLEYLFVDVDSVAGPVEPRLLNYNNPGEHGNLKTLKIDVRQADFPLEWTALLNSFPHLKYFGVGRGLSVSDSDVDEIFTAINEIRGEDEKRLELQSFIWFFNECYACDSIHPNPPSMPASTRHAELPLETFKYAVSEELPEYVLANLLSAYANSLKRFELYLYMHPPSFDCYFGFPQMNQLATLELTGVIVLDLALLRKLPNIRSLVLILDARMLRHKLSARSLFSTRLPEDAEADLAEEEERRVPSITKFHCDYRLHCTADAVIQLRRLMPNLSDLGMAFDNTSFSRVCRHLTQLEQLKIYGRELGDDGIIGIVGEEGDAQLSNFQPNISRLQSLKSFEMTLDCMSSPNFTKDSVIHGFTKVRRLEKLLIHVYEITTHAELQQVILERIPFAEIRVQNGCFKCGSKF